jgi:hypothetical protein
MSFLSIKKMLLMVTPPLLGLGGFQLLKRELEQDFYARTKAFEADLNAELHKKGLIDNSPFFDTVVDTRPSSLSSSPSEELRRLVDLTLSP